MTEHGDSPVLPHSDAGKRQARPQRTRFPLPFLCMTPTHCRHATLYTINISFGTMIAIFQIILNGDMVIIVKKWGWSIKIRSTKACFSLASSQSLAPSSTNKTISWLSAAFNSSQMLLHTWLWLSLGNLISKVGQEFFLFIPLDGWGVWAGNVRKFVPVSYLLEDLKANFSSQCCTFST